MPSASQLCSPMAILPIKTLKFKYRGSVSNRTLPGKNYFHRAILAIFLVLLIPAISIADSLIVEWQPNNPSPQGYRVYQRTTSGSYNYSSPAWPTDGHDHTESSCTINGLQQGATYCFIVKAYQGENQSPDSNEACYTIPVATHTINASSGDNGTISPPGNIQINDGENQIFDFTPDNGYKISEILVDGQPVPIAPSYTFSNVQTNHTISVTFASSGPSNQSPVAEAGNNQTVAPDSTVHLSGSGSYDPDEDPLAYQWTQTTGPAIDFECDSVQCTFTSPTTAGQAISLTFELTVSDGKGLFDSDSCIVMVNATEQPEPEPEPEPDNDNDGTPDSQDPDDDNDGIPDNWEISYGFDPFNQYDAANDPDGDGATNLQEYQAGTDPKHRDGNQAPYKPSIIAPLDSETDFSKNAHIIASDFDDPDTNDNHAQTIWQITETATRNVVFDRNCSGNHLTTLKLPRMLLDPSTQYSVKVRFVDHHGLESPWSDPVSFTTEEDAKDNNRNKIPDNQEVSDATDMNNDGVADNTQQDTIKSLVTYDGQYTVGVDIADCSNSTEVESVSNVDPMDLESTPYNKNETPYGLIGHKIKVDTPGDSARITFHLSTPLSQEDGWTNYNPIDGRKDNSNFTVLDSEGLIIQRTVKDGSSQDADGVENGIIVELTGPQATDSSSSSLSSGDDSPAAASGGGGGCFIGSLF